MPKPERVINVVVAGLGGQGVITSSDILADAAFRAGLDVKKSEIHGMSQRGGSVHTDVRFGAEVLSPMVPPGEADYLVVQAPDQVEPNLSKLKGDGVLIRPDAVDEAALANKRTLGVALLGVLSAHLPIPEACWLAALRQRVPERLFEANRDAFELGRRSAA